MIKEWQKEKLNEMTNKVSPKKYRREENECQTEIIEEIFFYPPSHFSPSSFYYANSKSTPTLSNKKVS